MRARRSVVGGTAGLGGAAAAGSSSSESDSLQTASRSADGCGLQGTSPCDGGTAAARGEGATPAAARGGGGGGGGMLGAGADRTDGTPPCTPQSPAPAEWEAPIEENGAGRGGGALPRNTRQ